MNLRLAPEPCTLIPEAARSNRAVSLPRERKPPSSALTSKVAGPWRMTCQPDL